MSTRGAPYRDLVRSWRPRHVAVALAGAVVTALLVGLPTDVVPNPVFSRAVPVTWWSYPTLVVTALLSGLLLTTYVGQPERPAVRDTGGRRGVVSGTLSLFAVGCPVCNKVVLLALGASGALTWFAPLQPLLALAAVAGLVWALHTRVVGAAACPVPSRVPVGSDG